VISLTVGEATTLRKARRPRVASIARQAVIAAVSRGAQKKSKRRVFLAGFTPVNPASSGTHLQPLFMCVVLQMSGIRNDTSEKCRVALARGNHQAVVEHGCYSN